MVEHLDLNMRINEIHKRDLQLKISDIFPRNLGAGLFDLLLAVTFWGNFWQFHSLRGPLTSFFLKRWLFFCYILSKVDNSRTYSSKVKTSKSYSSKVTFLSKVIWLDLTQNLTLLASKVEILRKIWSKNNRLFNKIMCSLYFEWS